MPPRRRKRKARHPYFNKCSSSWDIIDFLNAELKRSGTTHFSFNSALGDWSATLRELTRSGTSPEKAIALEKLAHYKDHRGGLSDKTLALNWNGARGRKRRLHLDEVTPVANNYHGTVNQIQGDMRGSTFNFDRADAGAPPSPPPPPPDRPRESTSDPYSVSVPPTPPIPQSEPTVNFDSDSDFDADTPLDDDSEDENEIDSPARLRLLCSSLSMWRNLLHDTLTLPSGLILEDIFLPYASTLSHLDPSHGFILDANLLSTLPLPDRACILSRLQPLPTFPQHLYDAIATATTTPPTISTCRALAGSATDRDLLWLSRVLEHTHELITHDLLAHDLTEGTYDSAVHPVLWDNYLLDLPALLLRRKELYLAAMTHNPYQLLPFAPRYDGVLRTRDHADGYELALFEVSARFETAKWASDKMKLVVGGRAMLCRLRELVKRDSKTVARLRVVGVLQAGRYTQLLVMQFVNGNVLHVREGRTWELPATMARLREVANVVAVAWKAKRVVVETEEVVRAYLRREEAGEVEVTGVDFL